MKKQEWGWDGDLGQNGNERLCQSMATHSSVLAWRILWTEEPGGLLSMGSHRVGHDWSDLAAAAAANPECKSRGVAGISGWFKHPTSKQKLPSKRGLKLWMEIWGIFWILEKERFEAKEHKHLSKKCYCQNFKKFLYILITTKKKHVSFFFFKLIYFYWRIIALQNFLVFCQTSIWISHTYTTHPPRFWNSLPSPHLSHPSRLIESPCLSFLLQEEMHSKLQLDGGWW